MRNLLLIFFIYFFCASSHVLGQNAAEQSKLKSKLIDLSKLLLQDSEEFYKEANLIKKEQLQDELVAVDFYSLMSEYYYARGKFDSMTWSLNQARSYIKDAKSPSLISIYLQLGTSFYFSGKVDSVKFYQNIVSKSIDEESPFYPQFLLVEGMKNQLASDYLSSIESIIQAAKILELKNDKRKLAVAYNNLAINYGNIDRMDLQLEYLQKAVAINKELGNTYQLVMNYNNLGVYFKSEDDLEKAMSYYELAYQDLTKLNSAFLLAQNLTNRANIHEKLGEYELAEELFLSCEKICTDNQILYGKMLSAINLGNLYRIQKKFDQAKNKLDQAFILSKELKVKKEESVILQRLSWLAEDQQDYKAALGFQSRYFLLNDSILSEAVRIEANELREKYESEKKENEIVSLSEQKIYQQLIIALMALGLLILVVLLQWRRAKHKLLLKEKQEEELKRKHLKDVLEIKDKEVNTQAGQLIKIQQQLDLAKNKISKILSEGSMEQNKVSEIDALLHKDSLLKVKKDFDLRLTSNNEALFKILIQSYPDLTPSELKLCAYLRLNIPTKDLADILNRSVRTIETSRSNIRKKLRLGPQENLVTFLLSFVN